MKNTPETDYLYKSESQIPNAGLGLFTAVDIYKDEIIAVFTGDILSNKEAQNRADAGKDNYFISMLNGRIMDSINADCLAKYANDAKGVIESKFRNNTMITVNDKQQVCIKAKRNIKQNEELFCSYGKRYWKKYL